MPNHKFKYIVLFFVIASFVSPGSRIVGKWRGVLLAEPLVVEFLDDNKMCTKFRNKTARFEYVFLNDSLLKIGADTHMVFVLNDSLLILRPNKAEKDISLLDIVELHKIR